MDTPGLIHSTHGQFTLLIVCAIFGAAAAFGLTWRLLALRAAAAIVLGSSHERDQRTFRRSLGWIWGLLVGLPLAGMAVKGLQLAAQWGLSVAREYGWVGIMLLAGGLTAAAIWWALRQRAKPVPAAVVPPAPVPVEPVQSQMWGLPEAARDGGL